MNVFDLSLLFESFPPWLRMIHTIWVNSQRFLRTGTCLLRNSSCTHWFLPKMLVMQWSCSNSIRPYWILNEIFISELLLCYTLPGLPLRSPLRRSVLFGPLSSQRWRPRRLSTSRVHDSTQTCGQTVTALLMNPGYLSQPGRLEIFSTFYQFKDFNINSIPLSFTNLRSLILKFLLALDLGLRIKSLFPFLEEFFFLLSRRLKWSFP